MDIKHFKFIDLFSLFIFLRITYIAQKEGFLCEFIKTCGVYVGSFLSLQFYPYLLRRFKSNILKKEYLDFISLLLLFSLVWILFSFLRKMLTLGMKDKSIDVKRRFFAIPLGIFRASLFVSLLIFSFALLPPSDNPYLGSFSYKMLRKIAPYSYIVSFPFFKQIFPKSKFNKEVKSYEIKGIVSKCSEERD